MRNINILNNSGINKDIYGYWPLNETSGKIITDRIGGHHATTTSDIIQKGSEWGGAMNFNSNTITCSTINIPNFPMTVSYWVQWDDIIAAAGNGSEHDLFTISNATTSRRIRIFIKKNSSTSWAFNADVANAAGSNSTAFSTNTFNFGTDNGIFSAGGPYWGSRYRQWVHFAITAISTSSTFFYLNGRYVTSIARGTPNNFTSFTLGTGSSSAFKAIDLKIWKRILNQNEIFQLAQRPYYGTEVGITRYQEIISTRKGSWFFFN
jgi:hypothetical protein